MEGVNMLGILLGYLALLVLAAGSLAALGLLAFRLTHAAKVMFAGGLLCAGLIAAGAALTSLERQYRHDVSVSYIILVALTLALLGAGPFVAAVRNAGTFALAVGCAVVSIGALAVPLLGGDFGDVAGLSRLADAIGQTPPAAAGALLAAGGIVLAVLRPAPWRKGPVADAPWAAR